jgi:hypothetical protein
VNAIADWIFCIGNNHFDSEKRQPDSYTAAGRLGLRCTASGRRATPVFLEMRGRRQTGSAFEKAPALERLLCMKLPKRVPAMRLVAEPNSLSRGI